LIWDFMFATPVYAPEARIAQAAGNFPVLLRSAAP